MFHSWCLLDASLFDLVVKATRFASCHTRRSAGIKERASNEALSKVTLRNRLLWRHAFRPLPVELPVNDTESAYLIGGVIRGPYQRS
jgi:hypothetical protein